MKRFRNFDCAIRGIYRSLKRQLPLDGHDYELVYESAQVEITRCSYCGNESVTYMDSTLLPDEM